MSGAIVLAATTDSGMYFQIAGRATFACCTDFRRYAEELLQGDFDTVDVNLQDCTGMDSTFMGVLAMLGIERMQKGDENVIIRQAGENNKALLEELGLTRLFTFVDEDGTDVDWIEIYPSTPTGPPSVISLESGKLMLKAHQTLMNVDDSNVEKFKDVVDSLESDLEDMDTDPDEKDDSDPDDTK